MTLSFGPMLALDKVALVAFSTRILRCEVVSNEGTGEFPWATVSARFSLARFEDQHCIEITVLLN